VSNALDADFAVHAQKSAKYRALVSVAPIVN
jgi:hypothetical protein